LVFAPSQRCPYRATSCRAILHSDSTYSSLRQRSATGRRLLLAQCFTWLVAGQRRATSIAIARKSRVILYDRAANLSVLIRNSTVQEMNPTPPFFLFFSYVPGRPLPFPITRLTRPCNSISFCYVYCDTVFISRRICTPRRDTFLSFFRALLASINS